MITVKKNAIKYKSSDGTMKDSGVLCQVGTFGEDWFQYATQIQGLFRDAIVPQCTEIDLTLPNITSMSHAFYYSVGFKKVKLSGNDNGNLLNTNNAFWGCNDVEIIDFSGLKCVFNNAGGMFRQCPNLKYIYGELDCTNASSLQSMFMNDTLLEYVRFKKGSIYKNFEFSSQKNLTTETVQNIIDGLADLTGQTAQTITFHKDVKAKLTEEQIATITSKNWTLA